MRPEARANPLALRRRPAGVASDVAFWALTLVTLAVPVVGIGLFEGGYNHVVKNVLYFAGASPGTMRRLLPPPAYELPNDVFFEATGVLQLAVGIATARQLWRLLLEHRKGVDSGCPQGAPL